jgi:hypothetical protein
MGSLSGFRKAAPLSFLLILPFFLACSAPAPPGDIDAGASESEPPPPPPVGVERAVDAEEDAPVFLGSLQLNKNGTVYTDIDTYDVRNIRFNTGHGFGKSNALVGYYLNTRYELEIGFIDELRVIGKISPSEARAEPHHFDMVEDKDLDYTFRTRLRKTDGERIEFVVRINHVQGELQEGGVFNLSGDELKALKKIVFF